MDGGLSARLTRQSGTNFYYAFRILPGEKRRAIYALYSFCRVLDDCVDEPGGEGEAGLRRWLEEIHRCYAGRPATELGRELAGALRRFPIPRACFEDIVAGCRMDLANTRYAAFADLRVYCERVASAVGLASIEIFGYTAPDTRRYAVELGVALQLTNILRDIAGDADRGRLYLPLEDLERFGVPEADLLRPDRRTQPTAAVKELLASEVARARDQYARARALLPAQDRRAMLPAEIMAAMYHRLLDTFEARGHPLGERLRLGAPRKAWLVLRAVFSAYRPRP